MTEEKVLTVDEMWAAIKEVYPDAILSRGSQTGWWNIFSANVGILSYSRRASAIADAYSKIPKPAVADSDEAWVRERYPDAWYDSEKSIIWSDRSGDYVGLAQSVSEPSAWADARARLSAQPAPPEEESFVPSGPQQGARFRRAAEIPASDRQQVDAEDIELGSDVCSLCLHPSASHLGHDLCVGVLPDSTRCLCEGFDPFRYTSPEAAPAHPTASPLAEDRRQIALGQAIMCCEEEKIHEPQTKSDEAYQRGVQDCIDAIIRLSEQEDLAHVIARAGIKQAALESRYVNNQSRG